AYLKTIGNAAPDKNNPEVKGALDDLKKGKNDVLVRQIETALAQGNSVETVNKLTDENKKLSEQLKNETDGKNLAEKRVEDARKALERGGVIEKNGKIDIAILDKSLKALNDDRAALEAVNEILKDAKVKGVSDEGVKELVKIKTGLEAGIAAVDKVLANEKTKEKGDKGVLEIVDARNKATKDRDAILTVIDEAFQVLIDGKTVPDGGNPRKELVPGVKLARQKAESPLAIPLAQLSMSLGSVASGTGKVVEQSFDMAKVFTELGYFRGREKF